MSAEDIIAALPVLPDPELVRILHALAGEIEGRMMAADWSKA